jgi:hypothetical protein
MRRENDKRDVDWVLPRGEQFQIIGRDFRPLKQCVVANRGRRPRGLRPQQALQLQSTSLHFRSQDVDTDEATVSGEIISQMLRAVSV